MRIFVPGVVLASGVLAASAALADGMKPGLWEMARGSARLAKMQAGLEHMPPEARKAMEETMRDQNAAFAGASGKLVNRVCLTPDQAANYRFSEDHTDGGCKWDKPEHSGSTVRVRAQCSTSRLEGVLDFSSDTAFTGTWTIQLKAQPQPEQQNLTGKWLGAKCGS